MGPTKKSTRTARTVTSSYDRSLPENWSVTELRQRLTALSISPTVGAKKSTLLRLYKSHVTGGRQSAQPSRADREQPPSMSETHARSPIQVPVPVPAVTAHNNNNGMNNDALLGAIRDLTSTVQDMRR
jgi:hypothetical protein